jgi:hypothetical protein
MLVASAAVTPMVLAEKITLIDGEPLSPENSTRYRSVVVALQYLSVGSLRLPKVLKNVI